ncbi:hypothetical protein [Embleya sp. NPDC001921]
MDITEANHTWRTVLASSDHVGVEQLLRRDTRLMLLGDEWSGPFRRWRRPN